MLNNKYAPLVIGGVVIVVAAVATLWYSGFDPLKESNPDDGVINVGGLEIAPSITDASVPAPQTPRNISYPDYLSKEARKQLEENIDTLNDAIEKNPLDINNWLDLALQYKVAADLEGAQEVWMYLTEAAPENAVSFYNLGYLYHFDLKDYVKSEDYYEKAIALEPSQEMYHTALHELYRYSYKQSTDKAVEILQAGIKQNPDSINLRLALAAYYRDDRKDKKNAVQYFTQARDLADRAGNAQLVMTLEKEISALSK